MTAADVSSQLKLCRRTTPAGAATLASRRQSIRTLGAVDNAEELGRITLPLSDGSQVRLDQIARITDGHAERTTLAFRDGKPVIGFQIKRSNGYSDVSVANGVREAMARFQTAHPEVTITEASNTVQPIEDNYHGSMGLLYEGAILAVLVVWWFLRDVRATLLSAVALPLSVLPTFLVMYLAGFSLNTMSLLSLSLIIGILVDDAIVEVENIARHLRMGKTPYEAAMEAADEIGLAVIATTLTWWRCFCRRRSCPAFRASSSGSSAITAVGRGAVVAAGRAAAHADDGRLPDEAQPAMSRADGWLMTALSGLGARLS